MADCRRVPLCGYRLGAMPRAVGADCLSAPARLRPRPALCTVNMYISHLGVRCHPWTACFGAVTFPTSTFPGAPTSSLFASQEVCLRAVQWPQRPAGVHGLSIRQRAQVRTAGRRHVRLLRLSKPTACSTARTRSVGLLIVALPASFSNRCCIATARYTTSWPTSSCRATATSPSCRSAIRQAIAPSGRPSCNPSSDTRLADATRFWADPAGFGSPSRSIGSCADQRASSESWHTSNETP